MSDVYSLQNSSQAICAANFANFSARGQGALEEADMVASFPTMMWAAAVSAVGEDSAREQRRALATFVRDPVALRDAVGLYYGPRIPAAECKLIFQKAMYHPSYPAPTSRGDVLPLLRDFAQNFRKSHDILGHTPLYKEIANLPKILDSRCPDNAILCALLGELEFSCLEDVRSGLEKAGQTPVALKHDGCLYLRTSEYNFVELNSNVWERHGARLKIKTTVVPEAMKGPSPFDHTSFTHPTEHRVKKPGFKKSCISGNIINLYPGTPDRVAAEGPHRYRDIAELYPEFIFEDAAPSDLARPGTYVLHYAGHAIGANVEGDKVSVYDDADDFSRKGQAEPFAAGWLEFSRLQSGARTFRVRTRTRAPGAHDEVDPELLGFFATQESGAQREIGAENLDLFAGGCPSPRKVCFGSN